MKGGSLIMTRILSLDDDSDEIDLLKVVLEQRGYESLVVGNEQEALSILRTQSIDLFTQDIAHAGLGGWDFLRLMKSDAALKHIPVIIISAASMSSQAEQAKQRGLNPERDLACYLEKPICVEHLIEGIEDACVTLITRDFGLVG
jgi:CheY-like chemotaxis protein